MFDVRFVSKTGATYNYFDVSEQDITEWDKALPEGWTMTVWFTPTDDGVSHHYDCASAIACVCPDTEDEDTLGQTTSEYNDACLACSDSERYDDNIHS